jgi:hypothetical protein
MARCCKRCTEGGIAFEGGKHAAEPTKYSLNLGGHETEGMLRKTNPVIFARLSPVARNGIAADQVAPTLGPMSRGGPEVNLESSS